MDCRHGRGNASRESIIEQETGILAHRTTPKMLLQSEQNRGSAQLPADCNPVLYNPSRLAKGAEEVSTNCWVMSSLRRRRGSWLSIYKQAVDAHTNRPAAHFVNASILDRK